MNTSVAATAAKAAVKEVRKLLSKPMHTGEWKVLGDFEIVKETRPGWWLVRVPRQNPLRLLHVPSGLALVGAYREMESDFASVPGLAQKIGKASGALHLDPLDYKPATFSHDQDYEAGFCWVVRTGKDPLAVKVPLTKAQADAKMFVMLECAGATFADGLAYHGGVTLGGGRAWKRCRARKPEWPEMFEERTV